MGEWVAGLGGNTDPLNLVEVELEVGVFETNINPTFKLFWVGGWIKWKYRPSQPNWGWGWGWVGFELGKNYIYHKMYNIWYVICDII